MSVEPVKLTITKSTIFRGRTEEFSNVYTLHGLDKDSTTATDAVIAAALTAEKAVHSANVNFIRAQIFSYGSTGPNFMYVSKSLSGVGDLSGYANIYRECAVMLRAKMARSFSLTRSNQPYLRKYIRAGVLIGADDLQGVSAPTWIAPAGPLATYVSFLNSPGSGVTLGNDNGDVPTGSWEVCRFLEHRQFPRGRKEY